MKTIIKDETVNITRTCNLAGSAQMNQSDKAYQIINEYTEYNPQNDCNAWVDILYLEGRFIAAWGEDSFTCENAIAEYIELETTEELLEFAKKEGIEI